ncbi:hypothetical protein NYF23_10765 [SAR92 clade bacterium H455]|uniref:DNA polymerase III subunit chi n=1 Tax=SAR92 clade bacterium H455 TaxID=2974818 RepID=A0ABY5TKW4_9GAMM|nr:hypothetical protein NYF23_10765 [SAR92 clade bacterium H455]
MADQTNPSHSAKISSSDLENLLDDLYSLQDNLLSDSAEKALHNSELQLPDSLSDDDVHNLEIPILSDVVDDEVDGEKRLSDQFNQAQQHLFEKPSATQTSTNGPSNDQINAVVNKLMAKMRPRIDQLLREKIRNLVVERFNREN